MEKPTNEQIKSQIEQYYKEHLSSGLKCEVKSVSMTEVEETDGSNVTATINFIQNATGVAEPNKVLIPCDENGNLDWTNTKFLDEDSPQAPTSRSRIRSGRRVARR